MYTTTDTIKLQHELTGSVARYVNGYRFAKSLAPSMRDAAISVAGDFRTPHSAGILAAYNTTQSIFKSRKRTLPTFNPEYIQ